MGATTTRNPKGTTEMTTTTTTPDAPALTEAEALARYGNAPWYSRESVSAALDWLRVEVGRNAIRNDSLSRMVNPDTFDGLRIMGLVARAYDGFWGLEHYNEETGDFLGTEVTLTPLAWRMACRMAS